MAVAAMTRSRGQCVRSPGQPRQFGGGDLQSEHVSGHIARMQQAAVLLKYMSRRVRAVTDGRDRPSPNRTVYHFQTVHGVEACMAGARKRLRKGLRTRWPYGKSAGGDVRRNAERKMQGTEEKIRDRCQG